MLRRQRQQQKQNLKKKLKKAEKAAKELAAQAEATVPVIDLEVQNDFEDENTPSSSSEKGGFLFG